MAVAYIVSDIEYLSVSTYYYFGWRFSDARSAHVATSDRSTCGGKTPHRCNRSRR